MPTLQSSSLVKAGRPNSSDNKLLELDLRSTEPHDVTHQSHEYTHHQTRRRISFSMAGQVPASQCRPISKEIRTAKPIQVQPADLRFISMRNMLLKRATRA